MLTSSEETALRSLLHTRSIADKVQDAESTSDIVAKFNALLSALRSHKTLGRDYLKISDQDDSLMIAGGREWINVGELPYDYIVTHYPSSEITTEDQERIRLG